jgi:hypothetical protein
LIHFDADPQELNQLFQAGFFNWIGQGVVQPRPERPPFQPQHVPGIPVPPHVSLQPEVPENDDGKRLFTQQSPNIVAGPICLYLLLLHWLTQMSKFPLHTHLYSLPTQERDSKPKPTTRMIKEKLLLPPPLPLVIQPNLFHPCMHLRDDFSHVISEIKPKGSTQPKANSENSKGDNNNKGKIASQSGKYGF